jgi:formate transporter
VNMAPRGIEELVIDLADQCAEKNERLTKRPISFFLQSVMGGAMVAFGAILALSVSAGIPWPGIANLLMGLMFGFSLVIILVSGSNLSTADMFLGIIGLFHRRIGWIQYLRLVAVSYMGNAIGSLAISFLVYVGGSGYLQAPWLIRAHEIASLKTGMSDVQIFAMGCLCTWILQTAVMLYGKARTDIGKMALAYYGPLAFVSGMTEHSIANIGFIALPILHQAVFTKVTHLALTASGPTARLSWGFGQYGWAHNQLFTLMGNFVGGVIFVGIIIHFICDPHKISKLYQSSIEKNRVFFFNPKPSKPMRNR